MNLHFDHPSPAQYLVSQVGRCANLCAGHTLQVDHTDYIALPSQQGRKSIDIVWCEMCPQPVIPEEIKFAQKWHKVLSAPARNTEEIQAQIDNIACIMRDMLK